MTVAVLPRQTIYRVALLGYSMGHCLLPLTPGKTPGLEAPREILYPFETISMPQSPHPINPLHSDPSFLVLSKFCPISLSTPLIPGLLDVIHQVGVWGDSPGHGMLP